MSDLSTENEESNESLVNVPDKNMKFVVGVHKNPNAKARREWDAI